MRKLVFIAAAAVAVAACVPRTTLSSVADAVIGKAASCVDYGHYTGTVYTQALAEYYLQTSCHEEDVRTIAGEFLSGGREGYGSFVSYSSGGNFLPELAANGWKELLPAVGRSAGQMWAEQPRNCDGLMVPPWCEPSRDPLFIDCVLAATPFFLYSGLALENQEYVDYAAYMTLKTFEALRDPESGLVHQARGVMWMERGEMTADCWSRGNGWGSMALAALLKDFPRNNPQWPRVEALAADFFRSVARYQDSNGLWHQEMTLEDSYPEISGSALLLYGIGRAIQAEVIPAKEFMPVFKKGLKGILLYVDADGNISNTCSGCLAWGDGSKEAYASHEYYTNEPHAFGPVLFAIAQARALGIDAVRVRAGAETAGKNPACHVRMVAERKGDIAWENDRAAFRVYSQEVKETVSSGVDYWGKRVDYPVIDKWYDLNSKGLAYHEDRGEGRDFYVVGKNRGAGGPGIMLNGELLVPEPYERYEILTETKEYIAFRLHYPPIIKDGAVLCLSEMIEMVLGKPFFKKTYMLNAEGDAGGALIATGLTDFGNADVYARDSVLSLSEDLEGDGFLCSAVIANPDAFASFAHVGKDHLLLMKPGDNASCLVGIAWSGDIRWRALPGEWITLVSKGYGGLCDF